MAPSRLASSTPVLTAGSHGRLTAPQDCEAAHHVWWRRATLRASTILISSRGLTLIHLRVIACAANSRTILASASGLSYMKGTYEFVTIQHPVLALWTS